MKWISSYRQKPIKYVNVGASHLSSTVPLYLGWNKPRKNEQYVTLNSSGNINEYYKFVNGSWKHSVTNENDLSDRFLIPTTAASKNFVKYYGTIEVSHGKALYVINSLDREEGSSYYVENTIVDYAAERQFYNDRIKIDLILDNVSDLYVEDGYQMEGWMAKVSGLDANYYFINWPDHSIQYNLYNKSTNNINFKAKIMPESAVYWFRVTDDGDNPIKYDVGPVEYIDDETLIQLTRVGLKEGVDTVIRVLKTDENYPNPELKIRIDSEPEKISKWMIDAIDVADSEHQQAMFFNAEDIHNKKIKIVFTD